MRFLHGTSNPRTARAGAAVVTSLALAAGAAAFVAAAPGPARAGDEKAEAPRDAAAEVGRLLDEARSADDGVRVGAEQRIFALGDAARSELERLARDPDQKRAMTALRLLASPRWDRDAAKTDHGVPGAEAPPRDAPVWPGTGIRIIGGPADQVGKDIEEALRGWREEAEKRLAEMRKLLDDARSMKDRALDGLHGIRIAPGTGASSSGTVLRDGNSFAWEEQSDGRVKVTVKEGDAPERVFEAPNREALRKEHPDVAKRLDEHATVNTWRLRGWGPGEIDLDGLRGRLRIEGLDDATGWWKRSVESEVPQRNVLGILWEPVSDVLRAQLPEAFAGSAGGVVVTSVGQGSLAARLGLERHDVLLRLAGRDVSSPDDIRSALASVADGGSVEAEFLRKGRRETRSAAK